MVPIQSWNPKLRNVFHSAAIGPEIALVQVDLRVTFVLVKNRKGLQGCDLVTDETCDNKPAVEHYFANFFVVFLCDFWV